MTNTDILIVYAHILYKFDKIDKAVGINKFKQILRLGGYISYKKEFFVNSIYIKKHKELFDSFYNRFIVNDLVEEAINNDIIAIEQMDINYYNNIKERFNIIKNELKL
tara:strand:+ start:1107 stop:1430 length:324 start_codon:yes stop_codon:yes gene_type:complete